MDKIMRYAGPSAEAQLINPVIERYERYNNAALTEGFHRSVYWDSYDNKFCYCHPFFYFCFYERKKLLRDIYNENLRRKMEEQEKMTQRNIQKKSWFKKSDTQIFL